MQIEDEVLEVYSVCLERTDIHTLTRKTRDRFAERIAYQQLDKEKKARKKRQLVSSASRRRKTREFVDGMHGTGNIIIARM